MRSGRTVYKTQSIETEDDLDLDDIIDLVEGCDQEEQDRIKDIIFDDETEELNGIIEAPETLYDELKQRLMLVALEKYDLEDLQKRLEINKY